ncbi:glycoside hydrolase family 3 N-terminal domain-containing protein [Sphaerisporangium sp. TRM90804]|uniref:glycoside hydrolase family 3 protein n=1 Tax=Sphaerisporangium sp. TRM90804 TaxID=3031113 RepID=UPI00244A0265|nr:glycoside hydrolase family 3 N-terminal domain-containing protein [Sphaerisporangium sp. TRM90804]MDH2425162.1 glycoside hydrolase family 3 N-terminal domain-containing protein [Sphaerisporangium sp. TRM90804]
MSEFLAGASSQGEGDPGLRRLAAGTLLAAFPGTTAPDWVVRHLENGLGGVTLFGFNVESAEQLAGLTRRLRSAGEPVISLDEEGGDVTRLAYHVGSPYPGNAALGAVDDVELTRSIYRSIGDDLARCGVNLDMAPDADVNTADDNPVIGTRSFGSDAALVARHTVAAVSGLQDAGVAACVKHFPGHGATRQDSHLEIPTVDVSREVLWERELVPFRAAIAAGTRSIMTAHVRVPVLTGGAPATLSAAALTELLRGELGYDGVVVSDALDMHAITDSVGLDGGAVLSLAAGSDLLCLGPLPTREQILVVQNAIVAAVLDGRLPAARLEEAAERVARLRGWCGAPREQSRDGNVIGLVAARRAVSVSGTAAPLVDPFLVEVDTPPTIAVGDVPWGFAAWLPDAEITRVKPDDADPAGLLERARGRSLVIVVKDAHRHRASQDVVSALLAARPDAIVVEMGLPIWRPTAAAYIATYGAARANAQAAAELLLTA